MVDIKIWLKTLIAAVVMMITIGGATRLTHSGLSMAEWKPLSVLPPLSQQTWEKEFDLYKKTPEYKQVNKGMSLGKFKEIYWWEYGHRLLGKFVGLLVILPLFFLFKNIPTWLKKRLILIFTLGGLQGIIGWWMVKSGLKATPAVSHIRLCAHFIMAFFILSALLMSLWKMEGKIFKKIHPRNITLLVLIALTIIYGTFVAGLKAGLIYNTFPLMEGQWIPAEWNFYNPFWKNFINNQVTVQWLHRLLALTTLSYVTFLWIKYGSLYRNLVIIIAAQLALGIMTLLFYIPIAISLCHQGWAIVVWVKSLKINYSEKWSL